MEWKLTFLRSRVARRIFGLFILCALLPIGALAVLSFREVTKQLNEQSRTQLRRISRAEGMSIFERLDLLDAQMKMMVSELRASPAGLSDISARAFSENAMERFEGLAILQGRKAYTQVFGHIATQLRLSSDQLAHVRSGGTLLETGPCMQERPCARMVKQIDARRPERGALVGQVRLDFLWGPEKLPAGADLYVLDDENRLLFSSAGGAPDFNKEVLSQMSRTLSGQFATRREGRDFLADYWSVFLKPNYYVPRWIVIASVSQSQVLAPLESFKRIFPLVTLLAVWVVLVLSLIQIRRSLVPLERLRDGTRQIANRNFDSRVEVSSGDEFQELATSFNAMAERLGRQFRILSTINEIDRAILSAWDTDKIVDALLIRLQDLLPFDAVGITLLDVRTARKATTYLAAASGEHQRQAETTTLTPQEERRFNGAGDVVAVRSDKDLPRFLAPLEQLGMRSFLVMPILLNENLAGFLSLGYREEPELGPEDIFQGRQVADQMAVALSNARLIEDLEQLSNGTLTALARAIDAKSPWTSGHSERVTNTAVRIARSMGLPPKDRKILFRAGLLHDVGKIGIPSSVLDKPGKLTPEEFRTMCEHVRLGARILEPIPGFAELIPIVLYHHEKYDGTGYPEGLAGEQIPLHARIFAVADVFDALTSERPYRGALPQEQVVSYIREGAGSQFDPKVVQVLLDVLAEEEHVAQSEPTYAPVPDAD